jgi:hypothetical protein
MLTPAQYQAMKPLALYRHLLKKMKLYPSRNRYPLILSMQEEFRSNRTLTDPKKINIEIRKAKTGAQHVDYYVAKSKELAKGGRSDPFEQRQSVFTNREDFIYF